MRASGAAWRSSSWAPGWVRALLALLVLTSIAACTYPTSHAPLVRVEVRFAGGPLGSAGEVVPTAKAVRVYDASGRSVRFDAQGAFDTSGRLTALEVAPGSGELTLLLPRGMDWHLTGLAYSDSPLPLAAASTQVSTARHGTPAVLPFRTLLGSASLVPRLPVASLLPGQELDLLLLVHPPGRADLRVPSADRSVRFDLENAKAAAESDRGVRIVAGSRSAEGVSLTATVEGLVDVRGEIVAGSAQALWRAPFGSSVGADMEAPTVDDLGFDSQRGTLTGRAEDDRGLASLAVYDGPVLLASTDLDLINELGVGEVAFPGGGPRFHAPLRLPTGDHTITVIATDFSGNETQLDFELQVP